MDHKYFLTKREVIIYKVVPGKAHGTTAINIPYSKKSVCETPEPLVHNYKVIYTPRACKSGNPAFRQVKGQGRWFGSRKRYESYCPSICQQNFAEFKSQRLRSLPRRVQTALEREIGRQFQIQRPRHYNTLTTS